MTVDRCPGVHDIGTGLVGCPELSAIHWLRHGSTTRGGLEPHEDRAVDVARVMERAGLPPLPIVHAHQKHTANVALVDPAMGRSLSAGRVHAFEETDAIVCAAPGVVTAVFTADCVPVFLVDTRRRIIALAHAGWKGTLGRIAGRTVRVMMDAGSDAADITAWIGPCISGGNYEVSAEMVAEFSQEFGDATTAGVPFASGRLLDLPALNVFTLAQSGLDPDRIHRSGICTFGERSRFYSYRGDGGTRGRIVSFMVVLDQAQAP